MRVAIVLLCIGGVATATWRYVRVPAPRAPELRLREPEAPALDVVDFVDGVLTTQGSRWSVGVAGDVVVLGDWDCDGEKTAALLRPTSGTVYVFDAWAAPEQALSPSTRQDVPGAADLRAIDQEGDGCDELEVVHSSGESTTVLIHGAAG